MFLSIRRTRPRFLVLGVLLAGLILAVGDPLVSHSDAQAVRKQIKQARRDLVAFERDLEATVETFDRLQAQLDDVSNEMRDLRKVLRGLDEPKTLYDRWTGAIFRSLIDDALESAKGRADLLGDLLAQLRKHIWEKGLERKEKIETLQDAIDLLQSAKSGDLITKAGVGGGQLITYSADWAAVAQCESSGRWHIDDYFDGGLQFLPSTWWGFGGGQYGHYAYQATRRQQIDIAERVLAVQGPNAWPNCFAALPADTDE